MFKYNENGKVAVTIYFSKEDIKALKEKFDINNNTELNEAIYEMISTYLELD